LRSSALQLAQSITTGQNSLTFEAFAFSMKKYLISLTALFAVTAMASTSSPGELIPAALELQWEGWDVKITGLYLTDNVKTYYGEKTSQDDSIFVCLGLTVKNNNNHGESFIPQNNLKIIIGNNTFDAEDLDQGAEYTENIQPTLTRRRNCYFELPRSQTQGSFTLQLGGLLANKYNLEVCVVKPEAASYYDAGHAADSKGDYTAAIVDYSKAIEVDPKFTYAYNGRGNAKDHKGDYDGAIADYSKAIEIDPDFLNAYNDRGNAKDSKGDYDGAIADYNKAIELNSKVANPYNNRGIAKYRNGDYDGAIADSSKAIEIDPEDKHAYTNRGVAESRKGDYDGAIEDFGKAIAIDPKYTIAYNFQGWLKNLNGDLDGAIADYNKALEVDPKFANAYENRGLAEELKGDLDGALKDLVQSDTLTSKSEKHDYCHLRIWTVQARQGHIAKANEELSRYLKKRWDGGQGDWPSEIGAFLIGKIPEPEFVAAADSPDVKKNRERHCQAWYYAAIKRLLAGDKELAADYFTKCLATQVIEFDEYACAKFELKALAGGVPGYSK
jgi:tetratricopeptide (TPR) repeat protein